ncbi:Osmotin thaumatin-like protein [Lenzites betulinus]|nr:Osmotin thaumatin-like protein [Lenzites betulinus]
MQTGALILVSLSLAYSCAARTFQVFNNCSHSIWPAIYTDLDAGNAIPNQPTGWLQPAFNTATFEVPDNWVSGRIWARTNCNFLSGTPGPGSCLTGGCNGGLECDSRTGTGIPPATLAEFTLGINGAADSYDVSVVDGYNLPMRIENNQGCLIADCPHDLLKNCPEPLSNPLDASGNVAGCKTACSAGLAGYDNSPYCCSGNFSSPATCPSSGVMYYSYFKTNCPNAYAYAFDESSGTALFSCNSALKADYTITFCPGV